MLELNKFNENEKKVFPENIDVTQKELIDGFMDHFESKGYHKFSPEPIIPLDDSSLLFTNATIVPLKKFILNRNIPPPGIVSQQPCLRTQNIARLSDPDFNPEYMSYFKMLGILCPPNSYQQVSKDIHILLNNVLNLDDSNIKILASNSCESFLNYWEQTDIEIEMNTQKEEFYSWEYGMPGIYGSGVTFSIRQKDGNWRDLGNIIQISDEKNNIIGYEFGFGVETAISRIYSLNGPFEAAIISESMPFRDNPLYKKIQDSLVLLVVLYREGINPGEGGRQSITRKIIRWITKTITELEYIDLNKIEEILIDFEQKEFNEKTDTPYRIISDIEKHRKQHEYRLGLFRNFVKNQKRLFDQKSITNIEKLKDNLKKKAFSLYFIDQKEFEEIIHEFFGDLLID